MVDNLLMFDSAPQIVVVLLIALVVFGPKRLPEIGKQIGSALRELRKATGDVMGAFNTDYEPEPESHSYTPSYPDYEPGAYSRPTALQAPVDLTDYTIVGAMPGSAHESAGHAEADDPYRIAAASAVSAGSPVSAEAPSELAGPSPVAAAAAPHAGAQGEPDA